MPPGYQVSNRLRLLTDVHGYCYHAGCWHCRLIKSLILTTICAPWLSLLNPADFLYLLTIQCPKRAIGNQSSLTTTMFSVPLNTSVINAQKIPTVSKTTVDNRYPIEICDARVAKWVQLDLSGVERALLRVYPLSGQEQRPTSSLPKQVHPMSIESMPATWADQLYWISARPLRVLSCSPLVNIQFRICINSLWASEKSQLSGLHHCLINYPLGVQHMPARPLCVLSDLYCQFRLPAPGPLTPRVQGS